VVEGVLQALVGRVVILVGVLGHNAHQELIQRVLNAFMVQ